MPLAGSAKSLDSGLIFLGLGLNSEVLTGTEPRPTITLSAYVPSVDLTVTETGSTTGLSSWVVIFDICHGFIFHLWAVWETVLSRTDAAFRLLCDSVTSSLGLSGI